MAKRTTIKDIAQDANVSSATVSYILNDKPGASISEETRKRVLESAKRLHYIPNLSAKRLKTNRTNCIAVRLSTSLMLPRYYSAFQGIRAYLEPKGYSILICNNKKSEENSNPFNYINTYLNGQSDGILYISSTGADIPEEEMDLIRQHQIPFSTIDCMGQEPTVSSILYDYFASSYLRINALQKKGYKKFLYLRPAYQIYKEDAREQGMQAACYGKDGAVLQTHVLSHIRYEWSMLDEQDNQHLYFQSPQAESVQLVKQLVSQTSADTCILANARELQEVIARILYEQHLVLQTPETEHWYDRSISYHFPHYDAGIEAARSLLNAIQRKGEVRKLSLQPILEPTNLQLF